ncbi:MAG: hypothetical protein WEB58_00575 [Planctomycetaceae bacterium]
MEISNLVLEFVRVLIWPLTIITLLLIYRRQIAALIDRIRHADLPGGFGIDLAEEIQEAKKLSVKVKEQRIPPDKIRGRPTIPITEANARLLQLGFRPSPSGLDMSYYRALAEQDPNIALAGLRIEIDVLARNLAKGFNVPVSDRDSGTRLIRSLHDAGAITTDQMQLTMKILRVCNAAVHGTPLSHEGADDVIATAEILAVQYLAWLSWGFDDGWSPITEKVE